MATSGLSKTQLDIVTYIKQGLEKPEIANIMDIKESTVRNHITAINHKMGTRNIREIRNTRI